MPQKFIDITQVHIVMVHLVILTRIATNITIAIHLSAPFLFRTSKIHCSILSWMRIHSRNIGNLTCCIGIEMRTGTIVPAQCISCISCTPTTKRHSPAYCSVKPYFSTPDTICRYSQCWTKRIKVRIGSIYFNS